jgi:predicted transcriptional regulator
MASRNISPTPRELEILAILWEMEEATVRDVYERMRQRERIAQNTVQTFLRAMEEKGLVRHREEGRAFVYRPTYSRERSVANFVDRIFGGAADQLVVSLLRAKKLSQTEIDAIEEMIRSLRESERGGKGAKETN